MQIKYPLKSRSNAIDNICLNKNCNNKISISHRHHCQICGLDFFCDNCAPVYQLLNDNRVCEKCINDLVQESTIIRDSRSYY